MSKSYDAIMKILEDKGEIADEDAKKIITEHGALTDEEKKQVAAAIRMSKVLKKKGEESTDTPGEVSMDAYLNALSTLDSEEATAEEKEKAKKVKEAFESQ